MLGMRLSGLLQRWGDQTVRSEEHMEVNRKPGNEREGNQKGTEKNERKSSFLFSSLGMRSINELENNST